jgi:NodT family efflux transporter outer membrane factor (OMF) lipoprotein
MSAKSMTKPRIALIIASVFVVGLAGCKSPIKKEGDAPDASEYVNWMPESYKPPVNEQLPRPKELWWEDFGSDELNELVESALSSNYDLRVAVARVAQTRAQAVIAQSILYPQVDLMGGYTVQAPEFGLGSASSTEAYGSRTTWQIGAMVSYEIDIWGKLGFRADSAYALALASEFNREAIALGLVGDVISTYFQIVALGERIEVWEKNLTSITNLSNGLERKVERGDATLIDLSQQMILKTNTEAQINDLKLQRERAQNRLAVLVGRPPKGFKIKATHIESFKVPVVQPGLPSDLLCRRPDIRKVEAELMSSKADLYAARANLLPSFTLSGAGGYGSYFLQQFAMPQSLFYNLTAQLLQNVFDGGKRRAEVQVASAKNVEKLEGYANTVLSSLRDVEDALAGLALTKRRYDALNQSRMRAQRLAVMSTAVVERGGMDYVQLYEVQRTVLNAEDAAVAARSDQLRVSVDLFKSLGGGTKLNDDPCLGGGRLPEPDQRWIDEARKADQPEAKKSELSQPKSQLGIGKDGGIINEGTGQSIGEASAPGVQNVVQ